MDAGRRMPGGPLMRARSEPVLRIAKVAQATGTTPRALRYYEEIGLLSPSRPSGQARVYDASELQRARDIVQLRRLGFSVDEIAAYLDCQTSGMPARTQLAEKLMDRLRSIAGEQAFLQSAISRLSVRPEKACDLVVTDEAMIEFA